jgi:hypothetical protein
MFESLKLNEKGMFIIDGLNTFIVVAIMLAITVYLLYSITTATPVITAGVYNTTQASINTGISNALNLAPILLLMIIAALVIAAVMSFTGGNRG